SAGGPGLLLRPGQRGTLLRFFFTLSGICGSITKAVLKAAIRTRSSGDRAPPSGGGSGGSNPPGCVPLKKCIVCGGSLMKERQEGCRTRRTSTCRSRVITACLVLAL